MSRDNAYLRDILDSAKLIRSYVEGISLADFQADIVKQDAVMRRLEIIGEATKRLIPETRAMFPDIPWQQAAGMRDVLIHDYDDVNIDTIWDTVQNDLPKLIATIEAYLATQPPPQ